MGTDVHLACTLLPVSQHVTSARTFVIAGHRYCIHKTFSGHALRIHQSTRLAVCEADSALVGICCSICYRRFLFSLLSVWGLACHLTQGSGKRGKARRVSGEGGLLPLQKFVQPLVVVSGEPHEARHGSPYSPRSIPAVAAAACREPTSAERTCHF